MTRPMPGPPEYWWYCTPPHGEPGLWTSDMDHDADLLDQTDDPRLHLIAATHREDATRLRTALNGETRD